MQPFLFVMEYIKVKSILSKLKQAPDNWFGLTYNMNLYRGCQHQCIYCDSRSECYRIDDFSKIQIKENALNLLEKEIRSKRIKGTIGTGSMNDPYMPIEKKEELTKQALQIIERNKFPVHIITKSSLVIRDIDIIKQIGAIYSAVSLTITTADDDLSKIIEPAASLTTERFTTLKELTKAGIYCGVLLMPILPFVNDSEENISAVVEKAKEAGAKYIIAWMGMTLRDKQREYYYNKLDKHFPDLKEKYHARYGEQYSLAVPDSVKLNALFKAKCKEAGIPLKMQFYNQDIPEQLSLF